MPEGLSFNPEYPACEDYDLWLRIASFHRIQLVPRVLAFYRRHSTDQATTDQARVARYNLLVKQRFLSEFPRSSAEYRRRSFARTTPAESVNRGLPMLLEGRPRKCARDLPACADQGSRWTKDLKYAIPSLLPYSLYAQLVRGRPLLT